MRRADSQRKRERGSRPACGRLMSRENRIDYGAVRSYFARPSDGNADCASYMAHAQDLPESAANDRFRKELETMQDWVAAVGPSSRVLDIGCGSGTWTELFAGRFASVIALEQSPPMLEAARARLAPYSNVELVNQDARDPLPPGPFGLVFVGGLCMYLSDSDATTLVRSVVERLADGGCVIFRESTIADGYERPQGAYQAIYRSVDVYRSLFREAGLPGVIVRRNQGYTRMEIAVELVELRRRRVPILPHTSPFLGALTWRLLRVSSPVSFGLLPRAFARLGVRWPRLQNHFFMLKKDDPQQSLTLEGSS